MKSDNLGVKGETAKYASDFLVRLLDKVCGAAVEWTIRMNTTKSSKKKKGVL